MQRAKHSKSTVESMVLGATTVIAELPFTLVVMASVGYIMQLFVASDNIIRAIFGYSCAVMCHLVSSRYCSRAASINSHIQRWRESNKIFCKARRRSACLRCRCLYWYFTWEICHERPCRQKGTHSSEPFDLLKPTPAYLPPAGLSARLRVRPTTPPSTSAGTSSTGSRTRLRSRPKTFAASHQVISQPTTPRHRTYEQHRMII